MELIFGLITGVLFGILLQRAEVIRYDRQLGALLLKDMTIVKFMLSTILVGMVGVYLLVDLGLAKLAIKPLVLGGNVLGGLIFGAGWALLGYCPGTAAAALGEGRLDALAGLAGMLLGAAVFAEAYPLLKTTVLTWGDYGKLTLPQLMDRNHWVLIPWFCVLGVVLLRWIHKRGL
ncbi:MAG: YeeE/YedE thiosulfate transporter family protein [Humidesulfovibrio sp.]|nr:YeeE/YedE family protein [Desulfovibrio sp.]MDO9084437.1 YeeE/YedE thiosulfate transporter family protein [Humidesulfovibrio sp.]